MNDMAVDEPLDLSMKSGNVISGNDRQIEGFSRHTVHRPTPIRNSGIIYRHTYPGGRPDGPSRHEHSQLSPLSDDCRSSDFDDDWKLRRKERIWYDDRRVRHADSHLRREHPEWLDSAHTRDHSKEFSRVEGRSHPYSAPVYSRVRRLSGYNRLSPYQRSNSVSGQLKPSAILPQDGPPVFRYRCCSDTDVQDSATSTNIVSKNLDLPKSRDYMFLRELLKAPRRPIPDDFIGDPSLERIKERSDSVSTKDSTDTAKSLQDEDMEDSKSEDDKGDDMPESIRIPALDFLMLKFFCEKRDDPIVPINNLLKSQILNGEKKKISMVDLMELQVEACLLPMNS